MDQFYLYLNSTDSVLTQKDNTPKDFTVELPRSFQLFGEWTCALLELGFETRTKIVENRVYICCDLLADSYVKNTQLPVARSIFLPDQRKVNLSFEQAYYLSVKKQEVSRVRVFIRDDNLQPFSIDAETFYCLLHLKKAWVQ